MAVSRMFTYTTRIAPHPVLGPMAEHCASLEHALYRHLASGGTLDQKAKSAFGERFGLPGRFYNGVETTLSGKIDAVRELRAQAVETLGDRIQAVAKKTTAFRTLAKGLTTQRDAIRAKLAKVLPQAIRTDPVDDPLGLAAMGLRDLDDDPHGLTAEEREKLTALDKRLANLAYAVHQKNRKAVSLAHRKSQAEADLKRKAPPLCFGSKELFRKQFHLKENGYADHGAWLKDWRRARASQFMIPGSHDEVSGNKTCKSAVEADGSISVDLRVPPCLTDRFGERIALTGLRFNHGHDAVVAAVKYASEGRPGDRAWQTETAKTIKRVRKAESHRDPAELDAWEEVYRASRIDEAKKARGLAKAALTWRFHRDASGWFAAVTITRVFDLSFEDFTHGAIGADLNVGFVSVMPVDHACNPLKAWSTDLPMVTQGLRSDQALAVIGDAVRDLVEMAVKRRCPIVVETLDFKKKKAALKETVGPRLAAKLSAFAYKTFAEMLRSRCARFGVRLVEINPAYTSHMGRCKLMPALGVSVHRAAAAMIARRGMGLSEGLFASEEVILDDGARVTLAPPARMGRRHVWSPWGKHLGRLKAALRARFSAIRSAGTRGAPPVPARCGRFPHRNRTARGEAGGSPVRSPHCCSGDSLDRRLDRPSSPRTSASEQICSGL